MRCLSESCWRICSKILGACCQSFETSVHFPFAKHIPILLKYFWLLLVEISVAENRSSNSSLSGTARLRTLIGLNPPRRSPTSLCWDRLMATSLWPRSSANCWTTAVFPSWHGK